MCIISATNYDLDPKSDSNYYNHVFSSEDGINWTEVTEFSTRKFSARRRHQVVVFSNLFWLFVGQMGYHSTEDYEIVTHDIWKSSGN